MLQVRIENDQYVVCDTAVQDLYATVTYSRYQPVVHPLDVGLLDQCLSMHRHQCSPSEREYMDVVDALGHRGKYRTLESIEFSEGPGRLPQLQYTLCDKLIDSTVTVSMRLPGGGPKLL